MRSGAAGKMHRPAEGHEANASSLTACAPFWLFRLFAQRAPTTYMSGLPRVWHDASFRPQAANVKLTGALRKGALARRRTRCVAFRRRAKAACRGASG